MNEQQIIKKLTLLHDRLAVLTFNYNYEKSEIEDQVSEIQQKCDHEDKTYYPDPSGNNDSHYECNTCGKSAKKL